MPLYVIERTIPEGLGLAPTQQGRQAASTVIGNNTQLGVTWLKAFPAYQLGTGWAGAMHGPFPEAHFVATGGVTVENAESMW